MDIILARHAESIANTQGIYQGQTYDTELSQRGEQQAAVLAKALADLPIDQVFTSPLKRTRQTAEIVCQNLLLKSPVVDPSLIEINHGLWEGRYIAQVRQQFPDQLDAWKTEPHTITMPEGENLLQVADRAWQFLESLSKSDHQRILIISHDAVIRVILMKLLRREMSDFWMFDLDAAGYSLIEWYEKFALVVKINENNHLNGLASDLAVHAL